MAVNNVRSCEERVKYSLFPEFTDKNVKESSEQIAEKYILKLSPFLTKYIWQNETFNLRVVNDVTGAPSHLEGSTCFDDNIEDEWFIVHLLFALSKEDPKLVIKVEDNDGEFLLIEAAECLPKWVNPKTSKNRVFIHQGALHLIPIACNPAQITPIPSGIPSIVDAVSAVRQFSSVTQASSSVQKTIIRRIEGYPRKIHELQHRAHCYVPASVATILKEEPRLLSAAVKAFYLRDPLDMKACKAMKYFPPETRVMTEVLFTRCLYAQLLSQKYEPDRRTGWNMPRPTDPSYKAHDLGMKLASGFEILSSNVKKDDDSSMDVVDMDFNNDVRWKRFASSLQNKGYFQGEIEGSKLYKQLMAQAKTFYLQTLNKSNDNSSLPGIQILKLLDTMNINYDELKEAEKLLPPADEDSWMDITPEQLDATLEGMANGNYPEDVAASISGTLKTFLHHSSGLEGAEVPAVNKNTKKQKVNLDTEAFSESVNNILDFRVPNSDDDGSSSSMSGYSDDDDDEVELGEHDSAARGVEDFVSQPESLFTDIKEYMEQMDRELAQTDVGRSFERSQPQRPRDSETNGRGSREADNIDEEEDDFRPVDINLTALKNILESYSSQQGLPGPASNLFASMGVQLPHDSDL